MKTKLKGTMIALVMVVIFLTIIIPSTNAGYDYDAPLGPDAIDALMPIPAEVAKKYGRTEKVRLCYNIAELIKIAKIQQTRIDLLEKRVVELEVDMVTKLTIDPNAVEPMSLSTGLYKSGDAKLTTNEVPK